MVLFCSVAAHLLFFQLSIQACASAARPSGVLKSAPDPFHASIHCCASFALPAASLLLADFAPPLDDDPPDASFGPRDAAAAASAPTATTAASAPEEDASASDFLLLFFAGAGAGALAFAGAAGADLEDGAAAKK